MQTAKLATKADLADLRADLVETREALRGEIAEVAIRPGVLIVAHQFCVSYGPPGCLSWRAFFPWRRKYGEPKKRL